MRIGVQFLERALAIIWHMMAGLGRGSTPYFSMQSDKQRQILFAIGLLAALGAAQTWQLAGAPDWVSIVVVPVLVAYTAVEWVAMLATASCC